MMSVCTEKPGPFAPALVCSSESTTLKRKSSMPGPPYSSGTSKHSRPASPALSHSSRGTMPSLLPLLVVGGDLLPKKVRATSRKSSCSGRKSVAHGG